MNGNAKTQDGPTADLAETTIAFIGLGIMGAPMAAHLAAAGFTVIGHDHKDASMDDLVRLGGHRSTTIADAARQADVVLTMLPDSPDVQGAALGPDGIYENLRPGGLHIDCSTIRPDVAADLAAAARANGLAAVDAPVSGGQQGAREASLSVMVGGDEVDVRRAVPILKKIGTTVAHVGGPGAGQTVKAANQLMVAAHLEVLAEALTFLRAYSVDLEAALDVLGGGLAGSTVLARKARAMIAGDFSPGFRIDLHHKDMGIVADAARKAGIVIPIGAQLTQLIASLKAQGDGGLDHSALILAVQRLSGTTAPRGSAS